MVVLKINKFRFWGLLVTSIIWVLYMVVMGTAWYQVRKLPNKGAAGDGENFTVKFKVLSLDYSQEDAFGHKHDSSTSWDTWNFTWTRSIFTGAYSFGVLCFVFTTAILVLLVLQILEKSQPYFSKVVKVLSILIIIFHTLAILIFTGITLAFKKDQDHSDATNPNTAFWPCRDTCSDSFVGFQQDDTDAYVWAPDAGWAIMVFAWPLMVVASVLVTRDLFWEDSDSSSGKSVTIPMSH